MNIKEYYEKYWQSGGYSSRVNEFCKYKKLYINDHIRIKNKKILDIGCGDGEFTGLLAGNGNEITGLDISETALNTALKRGIRTSPCDINQGLPFKDDYFDAVLIFDTLEHLFNPSFILKEINRVLRRGGSLYCNVPNAGFLLNRIHYLLTGSFRDFTALSQQIIPDLFFCEHLRFFSISDIKKLLNQNRLSIKKTDFWFPTYFQKHRYNKFSCIGRIIKAAKLDRISPGLFSTSIFVECLKL